MKWLLALTMLLLVPAAVPAPVAGFDYDSCVKSGTGTNMERMGAKAWRKAFDLSSRQAACARVDDEVKADEILRDAQRRLDEREQAERAVDRQDQAERERAQWGRLEREIEQERAERERQQERADRETYRQEQADRARQKARDCARSGGCSTTKDIQDQIDRSKREAEILPR